MSEKMRVKALHYVALMPEDLHRLSLDMLRAFDGIRFVHRDFTDRVLDPASVRSRRVAANSGRDWPKVKLRPRAEWLLDYRTSLVTDNGSIITAWIEPRGWVPEFEFRDDGTDIALVNSPTRFLTVRPSHFENEGGTCTYTGPSLRRSETELIHLVPGDLQTSYRQEDAKESAFVRETWRILRHMLTKNFDLWKLDDPDGPRRIGPRARGELAWASAAALDWTTEHPLNFILFGHVGLKKADPTI